MFHVWRSFHYDENAETIDAYVNKIKQVAALLNYGEPQILELCKNTLFSKLYWILFSINNLRDAVDAMKRVLTKEKIDKQLSGQSGTAPPFMKVGDVSHSSKKVSCNAHDPIKEQLEHLTSMVYNMSIQRKKIIDFSSLKCIQREEGDKADRILVTQMEIDHIVWIDKDKILDPITGDNHKTDAYNAEMTVREEVIDIKIIIIIIEMIVEIEEDKTLGEASVMIEVDQEKEA